MHQPAWRSVIGTVAAVWFVVVALNVATYADPVAAALIDLGRLILVGLAILSLTLVDLDWVIARAKAFARSAAQPTT